MSDELTPSGDSTEPRKIDLAGITVRGCKFMDGTSIPDFTYPAEDAEPEAVYSPSHYNFGRYEVIDVISDWKLDFDLGSAVKYIARAGRKDPRREIEDLRKAIAVIEHKIKMLEEKA